MKYAWHSGRGTKVLSVRSRKRIWANVPYVIVLCGDKAYGNIADNLKTMSFPDLLPVLVAAAICPLVFLFPGYAIGYFSDALMFRRRVLSLRIAIGILLSILVLPILTYLAARFVGVWPMWVIDGALSLAGLFLLVQNLVGLPGRAKTFPTVLLLFAVVWAILCTLSVMDIQYSDRLFQSVVSHDFVKHVAVTNAVTRTGIPPVNPSFYPQHPFSLVYYYFWFMLASLVDQVGGSYVTARAAVIGSIWWTGLALAALVFVYLRVTRRRIKFRALTAFALLFLFANGLDIIPTGWRSFTALAHRYALHYATVEWWNEQVTSWFATMVWVPHHLAGFIAGLTSLALLHFLANMSSSRRRWPAAVLAGIGFASAAGLSVWSAFTIGVIGVLWFGVLAWLRKFQELTSLAIAGAVACILALPFLHDLSSANKLHHTPVILGIRQFVPVIIILHNYGISGPRKVALALFATLPANYALELGFYALAGIAYLLWRRKQRRFWSEADLFEFTVLAGSVLVATFCRSAVRNNDLGWRAFLPAQFMLLVWAARYFAGNRNWGRPRWLGSLLLVTLVLGFATTALDLVLIRAALPLAEISGTAYAWLGRYVPSSRQAFYTKQAYLALQKLVPRDQIVQHNPDIAVDLFEGSYGDRQVVAADDMYSTLYGTPVDMYKPYREALQSIFVTNPDAPPSTVIGVCERFGISDLLVKSTDEAWSAPDGWVRQMPAIYQNPMVKVIACGHPSIPTHRTLTWPTSTP